MFDILLEEKDIELELENINRKLDSYMELAKEQRRVYEGLVLMSEGVAEKAINFVTSTIKKIIDAILKFIQWCINLVMKPFGVSVNFFKKKDSGGNGGGGGSSSSTPSDVKDNKVSDKYTWFAKDLTFFTNENFRKSVDIGDVFAGYNALRNYFNGLHSGSSNWSDREERFNNIKSKNIVDTKYHVDADTLSHDVYTKATLFNTEVIQVKLNSLKNIMSLRTDETDKLTTKVFNKLEDVYKYSNLLPDDFKFTEFNDLVFKYNEFIEKSGKVKSGSIININTDLFKDLTTLTDIAKIKGKKNDFENYKKTYNEYKSKEKLDGIETRKINKISEVRNKNNTELTFSKHKDNNKKFFDILNSNKDTLDKYLKEITDLKDKNPTRLELLQKEGINGLTMDLLKLYKDVTFDIMNIIVRSRLVSAKSKIWHLSSALSVDLRYLMDLQTIAIKNQKKDEQSKEVINNIGKIYDSIKIFLNEKIIATTNKNII